MPQDWMDRAECRFTYNFTELPPEEAKKLCRECPVTVQCALWLKQFRGLNDLIVSGYPIVYGGMTPYEAAGIEIKCIHGRRPSCDICIWRRELVKLAERWEGDMVGLADYLDRPVSTVRQSLKRWSPLLHQKIMSRTNQKVGR